MLLFLLWTVSYGLVYAGQLLFDGVPVDITTTANEDLVIAPGAGGNTQIGTGTGTNTHATSNDDLHLTGILEADGAAYLNSATTLGDSTSDTITLTGYLGSHAIPATDSTYDLGSSTLAWRYLYADIITGYNANLALNPASGYSLTGLVTKNAATGNEVAYDLAATINKATAGNYTGLKLNVTETSAPGAADLLLDLQVGGASMFSVDNVGNVTAAGGWNFTGTSSTDFKIGNTSDASTTNLSLTFGNTNPETITFTGATTDDFTFSDDIDMNANVIKNIGNAGTDFVAATGALNLAGDLTLAAGANVVMSSGAGTYAQTYTGAATPMTITADSMTAGNGISISADALTTGYGINVDSVSTAANSYRLINLSSSGANANATRTRYGIYSSMTGTGATSTNIAGYFSSTQAANNYGLIVENGYNGFGTTSPAAGLAVGAGTFSNPSANPGNDLYVTGNLEVDGTIYGPAAITGTTADTFTVNSDNTAAVTTTLQLGGGAGASGKIATTVGNLLIDTAGGTVDIDDGIIDLSSQTVDVTLNNAVDALNFDSNTLSIDASNNRVGIRALSPDAVLEIGDGGVGDRLRVLGDSGEPALLIDEGDNIVIGDKTGGYGGTYLEVDAITGKIVLIDGNVGIGTTGPSEKLMVAGNVAPSADSAYNLGASSYYWANTYTDKLYLNPTATLDGATAGEITQIGNIIPSVNDTYTLGKSSYLYDAVYTNRIYGTYGTLKSRTTGWESSTHFYPLYDSSSNLGASSYYWANTYTDKLYLNPTATLDGATAGAISITGNVGIGTTSPGYALTVNGDISIPGTNHIYLTDTNNYLMYNKYVTNSSDLYIRNDKSTGLMHLSVNSADRVLIDSSGNVSIGGSAASTPSLYVQGTGNVGIGTTSPAARLDVDGAAQVVTAVTQRAIINNTNAITTNAGATAVYGLTIDEPNITVGALTPTNASSLYISGAPTEATNNYALWVDSGNVQIDDNLTVSGTITGAGSTLTGTTADTFTVNSDNSANAATLALGSAAGTTSGAITTGGGDLTVTPAGDDLLLDGGLTVGSTTQAGDNNLRVEGTSALVGNVTCTGDIAVNGTDITSTGAINVTPTTASVVMGAGSEKVTVVSNNSSAEIGESGNGGRLGIQARQSMNLNIDSDATSTTQTLVIGKDRVNNTGGTDLVTIAEDASVTLAGTLTVNGDQIICDGDLTLDPAGGDVYIDGNVGIGDTSPDAELDVEGTAPTIYLTDSTASAKGLAIDVDANKADLREISGASGSLLCLDLANAVVGIGTATPSTTNALTLQRNGAILRLQDPNNGGHNYMEWYSNGAAQARTAYFGYGFDGSTDFTLVTTRGGSSDIVLDPENGVGIDLSGPLAKLAVFGGIAANYTDVAFPNLRGAINHYGNSGGLTIAAQGANNSTAGSGDITFQNPETNSVDASTDAALTTHMTIRYNGNVGIGTTDFDGTPAIGRLIAKGSTADGSTNALVLRDSGEANVFTVDTDGNVTAAGTITGSGTSLTGTTADTFTVNSDNSANAATLALGSAAGTTSGAITTGGGDLTVTPAGDDLLLDGGLTVGSTTQAGDNNLRVEGTSALVGNVTCTGDIAVNGGDITSTGTLTITPTTYFGIGTTPSVMLDVLGWDGSTWSAVGIRIANTSTDATQKQGRIKGRHYTNTEESLTGMIIDSQATASLINIGGGSGTENAATQINLYTASNNTTTIGTVGLGIDSSGNTTLAGDLAVNGGDITSTGDLTLDPAGNDVILDNANLTFTAGYDIRPATNTTTALNIAQADGTDFVIFDTSNKKVGIGGTPLTKLDISDSTTTTTNYITLTNTGAFAAGAPAIDFYNSAGSIHTAQLSSSPGSGYAVSSFVIAVADAAMALQTRLTIDVNGNVGIGPAAPTHKLDVSGAMYSRRYGLTDGATIAVDWNNGNTQSVTLAANRIFTFANGQDGGKYTLIIKQDGTGSRTVTWPAEVRWSGATAPTLTTTASKTDYFGFIYNGVDSKYDGVAQRLNF